MTVHHLPATASASSADAVAVRSPRDASASRTARPSFTGSWPSAAAWGAGLVQTALGAGAVIGADSGVAARAVGILLVTLGLATFVWGAANLAASRLVAPRVALAGIVAGVLTLFALLALAPARTSVFAVAVATALLMVAGAVCALVVRRGGDASRDVGSLRGVLGLVVAAAVIAVVVTPALGATQDARLLTDDGTVPAISHDH